MEYLLVKPGQAKPHSSIRFVVGPNVSAWIGAVVATESGAAVVVCSMEGVVTAAVVATGVVTGFTGARVVTAQEISQD
jgi:hypothetical protein